MTAIPEATALLPVLSSLQRPAGVVHPFGRRGEEWRRSPRPPQSPPLEVDRLRLVHPDAVPEGAVVVGVLIVAPEQPSPPVQILPVQAAPVEPDRAPIAAGVLLDPSCRLLVVNGAEVELTRREFDLLAHLVSHPGRVHTRRQLLTQVWDLTPVSAEEHRTVDVHVARLRRKLGAHSDALQTVRGVGYRWARAPQRPDGGSALP